MNSSTDGQGPHPRHPGLNFIRGIGSACLFGAIGFCGPILIGLSYTAIRWIIDRSDDFDRAYDLRMLRVDLAPPSIGAAIIFAASGWAAHAPGGGHRFVPTLVKITAISLISWPLLAAGLQGLVPRRLKGDPIPLAEPVLVLIFAIAPVAMALILSVTRGMTVHAIRSDEV